MNTKLPGKSPVGHLKRVETVRRPGGASDPAGGPYKQASKFIRPKQYYDNY